MSDQSIKTCNVCHVSKPGNAFDSYNAHYAHKTCRDCEMPANKKRKPNQDAVKPPSPEISPTKSATSLAQMKSATSLAQMKSATSLESAAVAMIRHAATIANAECRALPNGQKKCRDCRVVKHISDFPIKDGVKRRGPTCRSCVALHRRRNRTPRNRANAPHSHKICCDCGVVKPIGEFYRSGRDLKCIKCRLDYNRRSRRGELQNHKLPAKCYEIDHLVECVCQDVEAVESYVNAINIPSAMIEPASAAKNRVIVVDDGETDDEFVSAPATESGDALHHGQDEKQNTSVAHLNHPDRSADEVCNFTSGADEVCNFTSGADEVCNFTSGADEVCNFTSGAMPAGARESFSPRGLEKFDQIELIGVIAKVFHLEIIELKCVYPAEDVRELSLWKSQVRELYATQNPGADEAYRRIMFDYGRAARELKNEAALRNISAA